MTGHYSFKVHKARGDGLVLKPNLQIKYELNIPNFFNEYLRLRNEVNCLNQLRAFPNADLILLRQLSMFPSTSFSSPSVIYNFISRINKNK